MEPDGEGKPMTAVRGLDLERYMGRWYEIACFPSAFQPRDGRGTRATYALRPDGTVRVLNETWTADGSRRASIEGTAFRADPAADEARLKVRFYVPPFLPVFPVVGDYWVLFLDENYQYALVGQPSKKHLWILSRQIRMEEDVYNQLVEKAREQGYDVKKLQKTQQIDPPPVGEEGLHDTKGLWWIKSLLGK
ncbi:temperature-induced lipocalin-1-like isoform X1 [Phoenix dactylifera]|uniref:Temperature-induced lipocalin-1-like isoform X1 n=1 Tax=Phoenix dactylifera TaxID=42345 RepID=A0A8B7BL78_PHODC|nr:temperature-induced lipocalin-1-like isoform X1 [Phoenix dactylifera]